MDHPLPGNATHESAPLSGMIKKDKGMKRIVLLTLFLLLAVSVRAQLTNTSYFRWSANYLGSTALFSNQATLTTNFYKFLVTYSGFYLDLDISRTNNVYNVFPGTVLDLNHMIHNVGSINEALGVNLKTSSAPPGITVQLLNALFVPITNTAAVASGATLPYLSRVTIPTNYAGTSFSFYITNTGSTNGPPYPHRVIVRHTIHVVHQNVLVREATDGIHTVTLFDGTQPLGNLNARIIIEFLGTVLDANSLKLYYDMNGTPDGSVPDGTVTRNRSVSIVRENGQWVAVIPVTDPEVKAGNIANFIISADGRLYDNSGTPWRYAIRDYAVQDESQVTISVNNKFDPQAGETYKLIYKLNRQNFVNISVYNVRGELVTQLKNQQEDVGKYVVIWDGRNQAGKLVAMGLYLVNIQTAEFGDIRKVIVIKR
jgi:hypothetical protein